jgi:hypothetical protein
MGCVPLRPLEVGDILDGAFRVLRRNPRTILGLSVGVSVVQAIGQAAVQLAFFNAENQTVDRNNASQVTGQLGIELLVFFTEVVLSTLIGAVLAGMLAAVVTEDVLGIKLRIGQAWGRVRGHFGALIGLALITTVLESLGLIPLFVVGAWLWGIWAVAVPAMMVEGTTIRESLRRSRALTAGLFWRVWGIRALGAVLVIIVGELLALPFQAVGIGIDGFNRTGGSVPSALILFSALGTLVSGTFTAPIRAAIDSLLYLDLRMRKEGLDLVLHERMYPVGAP